MFLRLLVNVSPYDFLEEAAAHFSTDENEQRSDDELVLAALSTTADEKLIGFAPRPGERGSARRFAVYRSV